MKIQKSYVGTEGISALLHFLDEQRAQRILLVTGSRSFDHSNYGPTLLQKLIMDRRVLQIRFEGPLQEVAVQRASRETSRFHPDLVLAIGGGTALDAAKILKNTLPLPLVAIPTTAGTGSESTHFATSYRNLMKQSLEEPSLLPDFYLLDPIFVRDCSRSTAIAAGLDTLCQSIESVWNCSATPQSISDATKSLTLWGQNFYPFLNERSDANSLGLLQAANLSGRAIGVTRTTTAHALSYDLTSKFQIPHGLAAALNLASLTRFNLKGSESEMSLPGGPAELRQRISVLESHLGTDDLAQFILQTFQRLNLSPSLSDYQVPASALKEIAASAVASARNANNPRRVSEAEALSILKESF